MFARRIQFVAVVLASAVRLCAASGDLPDFDRDVVPILKSRCVGCHGPDVQESNLRLDTLPTDLANNRAAVEHWRMVRNVLNTEKMPPPEVEQLSGDERETLLSWISDALHRYVEATKDTDGRVVMRRLNRVEYQHTMTDLLNLQMDYARDLPPDAVSADGFRNNGRSLRMSALQLEYYLETARRALGLVIVEGEKPPTYDYEFTEVNLTKWLGNADKTNRLQRSQEFLATMKTDYPETGDFVVRVKLDAELRPDTGFPLLEVSVGYRPDTKILLDDFDLVEITKSEEQVIEFRGRIENFPLPVRGQGKYPGLVVRLRNVYDDGSPKPKRQKNDKTGTNYEDESHLSAVNIKSVQFRCPPDDAWPPLRHQAILFDSPKKNSNESEYMSEVLHRFMRRAWRRPVQQDEVAKMVNFFESIRDDFPTFEECVRETLAMVLISPDFLYILEPAGPRKRPVNDYELACRLSYFLWSTMPDARLFQLADDGKLNQNDVLAEEVERMLSDRRSERFVNQFTDQWLHLHVVDSVAVDSQIYPGFDDALKEEMQNETREFVGELIGQNKSALELLSARYSMLNEPLAAHYGIEGVVGRAFRKVEFLPEHRRQGLLGHGSVLLSNSTGADSHAVRRAVWIRDRLLNDPPNPPPPDVPSLEEADPEFHKLSVREQLARHRGDGACSLCHQDIDPWGIALEHYDAVGLWREEIRRQKGKKKFETHAVVAKDSLPNGVELDGADSLRDYILNQKTAEFTQSLVERMATYAVGRDLELSDELHVSDLTVEFKKRDYKIRDLVKLIVQSDLFRTK